MSENKQTCSIPVDDIKFMLSRLVWATGYRDPDIVDLESYSADDIKGALDDLLNMSDEFYRIIIKAWEQC